MYKDAYINSNISKYLILNIVYWVQLNMKYKKILIVIVLTIILCVVIGINQINTGNPRIQSFVLKYVPEKIVITIQSIYRNQIVRNYQNAYNLSVFPKNNYGSFQVQKKKLSSISEGVRGYSTFFLGHYKNKIFTVDSKAIISYLDADLSSEQVQISSNLNFGPSERVLDINIAGEKLYISAALVTNNCGKHHVLVAELNTERLLFDEVWASNLCARTRGSAILSGRIISIKQNGVEKLMLSSSNSGANRPTLESQDPATSYGKILMIDPKNGETSIQAFGIRNTQGLVHYLGKTFMTDHGPDGGDELNVLTNEANFGWPYASYGAPYPSELNAFLKDNKFFNDHEKHGFKEPIFAFVPSIGISELVVLDDDYYPECKNCILISSLNGRSLFFMRMSKDFDRVIFREKIYVGERIRDMFYDKDEKSIYLALEETGSIAKISNQILPLTDGNE